MTEQTEKWTGIHTVAAVAIVILMFLIGLLVPNHLRLGGWVLTLILLAAFIVISGHGITGLWRGALIDERNQMSLSRLQIVLWTVIVLSGYFTAALANLTGQFQPRT